MTEIKLSRPLPGASVVMLPAAGQTTNPDGEDVSEIVFKASVPEDFVTLEDEGFSLSGAGKMAEDDDHIGAVTQTGSSTGNFIRIDFTSPVELPDGVRLTLGKTRGASAPTYVPALVMLYDNPLEEGTPVGVQITAPFTPGSNIIDIEGLSYEDYIYVKAIIIDAIPAAGKFFARILNASQPADFGEVKVIGQVELHTEMAPALDDLPMTTGELTAEMSGAAPNEGDELIVQNGSLTQSLLVEQVSRVSADIYSISCYDSVHLMDEWVIKNSDTLSQVTKYTDLRGEGQKCPITIEPLPSGVDEEYQGLWKGEVTCRQAYAQYQAALGRALTSWQAKGLRWVKIIGAPETPVRVFEDEDIIGYAEYSRPQRFGTVAMTVDGKSDENTDWSYAISDFAPTSKGSTTRYDFSKCRLHMKSIDGDQLQPSTNTLKRLATLVNADEVSFTAVYNGESVGDWVTVETLYDGTIKGRIVEMSLTVSVNQAVCLYRIRGEKV